MSAVCLAKSSLSIICPKQVTFYDVQKEQFSFSACLASWPPYGNTKVGRQTDRHTHIHTHTHTHTERQTDRQAYRMRNLISRCFQLQRKREKKKKLSMISYTERYLRAKCIKSSLVPVQHSFLRYETEINEPPEIRYN